MIGLGLIRNENEARKSPVIRLLWLVLVAAGCLTVQSRAASDHEPPRVDLELELADARIPADGVVVGELVFYNHGASPVRFGGVVSIDAHSGRLVYELVAPSGRRRRLIRSSGIADAVTAQQAELRPGEFLRHPICLVKLDGEYLFSEEGLYRLRAVYRTGFPRPTRAPDDTLTAPLSDDGYPPQWVSTWAEIEVGPVGAGRARYIQSHPRPDLYRAFQRQADRETIRDRLAGIGNDLSAFQDYRHEQEKLLVYQQASSALLRCLVVEQRHDATLIEEARLALDRAERYEVGVAMWTWLVSRLETFPGEAQGTDRYVIRNGYYF